VASRHASHVPCFACLAHFSGLVSPIYWSTSMPSIMEVIKCACHLSALCFVSLVRHLRDRERTLPESPQPYWRQKKIGAKTRDPWWIKSSLLLIFLPGILGARLLITTVSAKPVLHLPSQEQVGLRRGWLDRESQPKKPKRPTSSESILAHFAESPIQGS